MGITVYGCDQDEAILFQELAPQFDITPTITQMPLSESTVELAFGNRCISVSHKTHVTKPVIRALSKAGVVYISTRSAGYDHIDVNFARSVGISVGNVTYSPDSVADYTIMLLLMTLRSVKSALSRVDNHDFRLPNTRGRELRDMTVGVVGTGRIGTAVVQRLQGFGCQVLVYDHHPKTSAEYVSLDELLQKSDVVTLHMPLNKETYHLLDHDRIKKMKQGAFVINTGRGSLIDTKALITALQDGKLGGAALDVLEGEEGIFYTDYRKKIPKNGLLSGLEKMPNTTITPHIAYYTDHALRDVVENTITNCLKFEEEK